MTQLDATSAPDTASWGARHAHDPTAVRDDDGTYWLFSTDAWADGPVRAGVQVRRSTDLVTWEFHGWALDGVPTAGAAWSGATGLWAPEVVRVGDEWRMYWSASTFGSRTSAIGLAVASHPAGPWQDRGLVVTSLHDESGPNAIDANVVVDDGRHWLVYGSFFAGIHALELDPDSGLARGEAPGVLLACRPPSVEGAVEGAYVLHRPGGGFALVVSYDSLFSTYHVRVGVSDAVTGPYVDRVGRALTEVEGDPARVGTVVLAGHQLVGGRPWLAPGHASVLTEPDHQVLVHHVRDGDDPTQHEVQVRRLVWTADGWPVVSPQPWAGDLEVDDTATWPTDPLTLAGTWELVTFDRSTTGAVTPSRTVDLERAFLSTAQSHGAGRFSWPDLELVVFPSVDAVRGVRTISFTGLDAQGNATLGTRVVAS